MPSLDTLTRSIESGPTLQARLETLVDGLADRIKATSNDQNIQRLSRDLRSAAAEIVNAIVAEPRR